MGYSIRHARTGDIADVIAFTQDTWSDQDRGDYLPDRFPAWVRNEGTDQQTFVADVNGRAVGTLQVVRLSSDEAWLQGLRVAPSHRGKGIGTALIHAGFSWAKEAGASFARGMVFSWNEMGLGLTRAAGFDPTTEFRWAHPEPDATAAIDPDDRGIEVRSDPMEAWTYWTRSDACTHLSGIALDMDETWAVSSLTLERLKYASEKTSLIVIVGDGTRAITYRTRTVEYEADDGDKTSLAEYGVAAWTDPQDCGSLMSAIARDAADCGVNRTRVLIPETVETVSDVALAGHPLADHPDYVLTADLTMDFES